MDVSGPAARALAAGKEVTARLTLVPDVPDETLSALLTEEAGSRRLAGIVPSRLAAALRKMGDPSKLLRDLPVRIGSTGPFAAAQCATGGIPTEEVRRDTMESVFRSGLYLCGEIRLI